MWSGKIQLNPSPTEYKIQSLQANEIRLTTLPHSAEEKTPIAATPRIYIQIRNESQRGKANTLMNALQVQGKVNVPGIEQLDVGPSSTELRYFHQAEQQIASDAAQDISKLGYNARVKYVPGFETSKAVRAKQLELWIAE